MVCLSRDRACRGFSQRLRQSLGEQSGKNSHVAPAQHIAGVRARQVMANGAAAPECVPIDWISFLSSAKSGRVEDLDSCQCAVQRQPPVVIKGGEVGVIHLDLI